LFNDLFSQIIVILYAAYVLVSKYINLFITRLGGNILPTVTPNPRSFSKKVVSDDGAAGTQSTTLSKLFAKTIPSTPTKTNFLLGSFSKKLSVASQNISLTTNSIPVNSFLFPLKTTSTGPDNFNYSTIKLKKLKRVGMGKTLTDGESYYSFINISLNSKSHTTRTNLNSIYRISMLHKNLTFFNFNLENNINISKQQRWLVKNSLLSESIVPNSFLITQVKKLLGSGIFDKDFGNKTLWLPAKSSQLSSTESTIYLNNLKDHLFKNGSLSGFLQTNSLNQVNFSNLNFFENSRLWLFKKYFFTNSQGYNTVVDYPQTVDYLPKTTTYLQNENINFTTSLYLNNLLYLVKNYNTPSLFVLGCGNTPENNILTGKLVPLKINTSQLDMIAGDNLHFYNHITTNTKSLIDGGNPTTYFKFLLNRPVALSTSVKFYK
jgi:hypothetical protein